MERIASELADQRAKKDAKSEADYKKSLDDFPDGAVKQMANKVGVERYAAYKLLNKSVIINEYCDFIKNSYAIENEKNRQMDLTLVNTKKSEIEKQFELKQIKLLSNFNSKTGLRQLEYVAMSMAGDWNAYCRANEHGWQVFTEDMAVSVEKDDIKIATNNIAGFYISEFIDNTSCEWKNYKNFKLVGCRMRSFSATSNWHVFLIGKLKNGLLAAYPVNGRTKTAMSRFENSSTLKPSATSRAFMEGGDGVKIYLAYFAYTGLPVKEVMELFEGK